MPHVLIVADDLTGALDSSVAFAAPGRRVVVSLRPDALPAALARDAQVLVLTTASREIAADAARARTEAALTGLDLARIPVVMKKVDSRLKGNTAVETAVLANAMAAEACIACPAIPDMDRVVSGGALTGMGVAAPIDVAARFDLKVEVPDTLTEADLDAVVSAAQGRPLWIGARGLARALARQQPHPPAEVPPLEAPLLIASGSRDPVTLAQMDALREAMTVHLAPDGAVPPLPEAPRVALSISDGAGALTGAEAARRYAQGLLAACATLRPRSLLICGGETAQALLDALGIDCLEVLAELRPGLPLCRIVAPWGPVLLVTKSGGFGGPGLLHDIATSAAPEVSRG